MGRKVLRWLKLAVLILALLTAVMYLLNGLVAAVGFDGFALHAVLTAGKGLYVVNTIVAIALIAVGFGVYSRATKAIKIVALIGVVIAMLGYVLNPVGIGMTAAAMFALVLALITATTAENVQ